MKKEMLINVLQPEECRIAIVEDGVLEELYVERTSHESYVGNIYKGRIVNIEPSIQAAFVDFGVGRNGFLHVSDVEPAYYRHLEPWRNEPDRRGGGGGRRGSGGGRRPPRMDRDAPVGNQHSGFDDDEIDDIVDLDFDDVTEIVDDRPDEGEIGNRRDESQPAENYSDDSEHDSDEDSMLMSHEDDRGMPADLDEEPEQDSPREIEDDLDDADLSFSAHSARQEEEVDEPEESAPNVPPSPYVMQGSERRTEPDEDVNLSFSMAVEHEAEVAPQVDDAETTSEEFQAEPVTHIEEPETEIFEEPVIDRQPRRGRGRGNSRDRDRDREFNGRRPPRGRDDRRGDDRRGGRRGGGFNRRPGGGGGGRSAPMGRPKPLIQDIFRKGQEVLVQVIKEGIGTKGPTLSTYISIAGRYLVLMPGLNRIGVSRKITDEEQRRRLRDILSDLKPPRGIGFIIRTAGMDRTKQELQRDLAYLARLWQVVVRRIRKLKSPAEIYQESDMITRTIRDTFTGEIDGIVVDETKAFEHAQEFLQIVMPRYASRLKCYSDSEPMFHRYGIEDEIARIHKRHVPLPNGGSIVIDQTEALVAIDVNSGNFRADNNAEETAYQMNILAAREIARQLRLRDLGGVIVNDFIDMREEKHRRGVERALRDAVRRDRARTKILRISAFGMIEMTRQRIRPSLKRSVYQDCPHCTGTGQVKTCESMSIEVMRQLQLAAHRSNIQRIEIHVHNDVANYLSNRKRIEIAKLEEARQLQINITGSREVSPETMGFVCYDRNNNEIKFVSYDETPPPRRRS